MTLIQGPGSSCWSPETWFPRVLRARIFISAVSGPRQLSTSATGDTSLSDDSGVQCLSTSTLLALPCISGETAGTRLFESDDIISCVTQLLLMYALWPENSGLSEPFVRNMPDLMFLVLNGTGMVPMHHPVCVYLLRTK